MKTKKYGNLDNGITLALAVPAAAENGKPLSLGADGLIGVPVTSRATTATIKEGKAASGLRDGEASTFLPGISVVLNADLPAGVAQYGKVYLTPAGAYSDTAAGNTFVGYKLAAKVLAVRSN